MHKNIRKLCFFVIILSFTLAPAAGAQGNIIRVDVTTGNDTGSCGSVSAPCKTIQQAVTVAQSGDMIRIAQGTYTGSGSAVISLGSTTANQSKNLTLIGGYTAANWETPSNDNTKTILDGQNARRVISIVSVDSPQITFQNLTIQNGLVNENSPIANTSEFSGGGLLCRNDNPNTPLFVTVSLSNVVFKNNQVKVNGSNKAVSGGGASFYFRCSANLQNVTFEGNLVQGGNAPDGTRGAQALGGGLFMSGGFGSSDKEATLVAQDVVFTNNKVIAGSGGIGLSNGLPDGLGGGAAMQLCKATLTGVTATGNQAVGGQGSTQGGTASGGALFFELNNGTVKVSQAILQNNSVTGGASSGIGGIGSGGALMATDSILELSQITILNNTSVGGAAPDGGDAGGGAMYFTKVAATNVSKVTGTNLIIAENKAEAGAGDKRYGGGGGIFSQDTDLTLTHVTLVQNSVLNTMLAPAVIGQHNLGTSSTTIAYSIVANHDGRDIFNNPRAPLIAQKTGDTMTLNYVLFDNNTNDLEAGKPYSGQPGLTGAVFNTSNDLNGDPAFVAAGDYHLQANSAAIDQAVGSGITVDVDGEARPHGAGADVGADEYQVATPNLSSSTKSFSPHQIGVTNNRIGYVIVLKNSGRGAATGVTLTDPLPTASAALNLAVSGQVSCTEGSCQVEGATVKWTGDLAAKGQVQISYTVEATIPNNLTGGVTLTHKATELTYAEGNFTLATPGTIQVVVMSQKVYLPLVVKG